MSYSKFLQPRPYPGQQQSAPRPALPLRDRLISLDNPTGRFAILGLPPEDNTGDGNQPDRSYEPPEPRKRINARPRNNIYMSGTGPGTGRTAIRIGTFGRDGSASPVSSMGYATGPLSTPRPSSLPPKPPAPPPAPGVPKIPARAMGGPVRAGRPYLVGEEGPEVIVPKQSGTVVPNHALSYQPLDKAPAQPPSPAGGYIDDPASDDADDNDTPAARTPAYDASFDEPHELPSPAGDYTAEPASDGEEPAARPPAYDASFDEPNVAADDATEPNTEPTPAPAERPTTGLLMRPRPMPPEFAQQQQARSGNPSAYSRGAEQADTDAPPANPSSPDSASQYNDPPQTNLPLATPADTPPATASRFFEQRNPPGTSAAQQPVIGPNGPSPQQRLQESQRAIAALQQQVRGSNPPAKGSKPAAQPQAPAQAQRPAPPAVQNTQPTFKIDPAHEAKEFMLSDPATGKQSKSNRTFGDHVRTILQDELDNSPSARRLLEQITKVTGKPVIIQMKTEGEARPVTGKDGSITITVNPATLRSGTLSHEITHFLQGWVLQQVLKDPPKGKDGKTDFDAIGPKVTAVLNDILQVSYASERDRRINTSQNYMENEAMRAGNIAKAEISAARVKAKLDAMSETERASYLKDRSRIAALFWAEQGPQEATGHDSNSKLSFPLETRYGEHHFEHVLKVLGLTEDELRKARPY